MKALRFPAGLYGVTPEWDDTERLLQAVRAAAAACAAPYSINPKSKP